MDRFENAAYFMSYIRGFGAAVVHGGYVVRGEHPFAVVRRWNTEERQKECGPTALLWFRRLDADDLAALGDGDFDHEHNGY